MVREVEMRLRSRLWLVAVATGVAAIVFVGRKPFEGSADETEPVEDSQGVVETETDNWFV